MNHDAGICIARRDDSPATRPRAADAAWCAWGASARHPAVL